MIQWEVKGCAMAAMITQGMTCRNTSSSTAGSVTHTLKLHCRAQQGLLLILGGCSLQLQAGGSPACPVTKAYTHAPHLACTGQHPATRFACKCTAAELRVLPRQRFSNAPPHLPATCCVCVPCSIFLLLDKQHAQKQQQLPGPPSTATLCCCCRCPHCCCCPDHLVGCTTCVLACI